jgi:polyisoprenoid-binding protein YceI
MKIALFLALAGLGSVALAAPQKFDFKDPKGVNNVAFRLDAPLEAINGSASGISGVVSFDPAHPGATSGRIVVASASMTVPNPLMQEHMQGAQWLNAAKHPEIVFEARSLKNVRTTGDTTTADATGSFTLKGVTKELTVPVRMTYLKDKLEARTNGKMKGDLLVLRAQFSIRRSDYGVMAGQAEDKVAETIELTLSVAGAAPR